jgi:hypothetical protein
MSVHVHYVIGLSANKSEGIITIGSSGRNFTASRIWTKSFMTIAGASNLSHAECVMCNCMQRNGYSFAGLLGEPDF